MTEILKFQKATNTSIGALTCKTLFKKDEAGPEGYPNYILVSDDKISIPHVDMFNVLKNIYDRPVDPDEGLNVNGKEIVLKGNTREYQVSVCGNDIITSLKQYFLNNKTRDGIQYLIWVDEEAAVDNKFKMIIPGVVCDETSGAALCYMESYEMDENARFSFQLPYNSAIDFDDYSIKTKIRENGSTRTIEWEAKEINGNVVTLSSLNREDLVKTQNGAITFTIKAGRTRGAGKNNFFIYPKDSFVGNEQEFIVKNVNEFGDYISAARIKGEKKGLNLIEEKLTTLNRQQGTFLMYNPSSGEWEHQTTIYYAPDLFHTLINDSPSEQAKNITPSIYKTPAALVNKGDNKIFMTDVVSMSANKIETI